MVDSSHDNRGPPVFGALGAVTAVSLMPCHVLAAAGCPAGAPWPSPARIEPMPELGFGTT